MQITKREVARDIREYHYESRDKVVTPVLVLTKTSDEELEWAVLLILVGEGQEINNGENSGLAQ